MKKVEGSSSSSSSSSSSGRNEQPEPVITLNDVVEILRMHGVHPSRISKQDILRRLIYLHRDDQHSSSNANQRDFGQTQTVASGNDIRAKDFRDANVYAGCCTQAQGASACGVSPLSLRNKEMSLQLIAFRINRRDDNSDDQISTARPCIANGIYKGLGLELYSTTSSEASDTADSARSCSGDSMDTTSSDSEVSDPASPLELEVAETLVNDLPRFTRIFMSSPSSSENNEDLHHDEDEDMDVEQESEATENGDGNATSSITEISD